MFDDALEDAGKVCDPACFIAGTKVLTIDGLKAIEDIEVGDVFCFSKGIEYIDVNTHILYTVDVFESKLGQSTIDGHLTTFETNLLMVTRTGLCTFVTTCSGATFARACTTTHSFGMLDGTFCGLEII